MFWVFLILSILGVFSCFVCLFVCLFVFMWVVSNKCLPSKFHNTRGIYQRIYGTVHKRHIIQPRLCSITLTKIICYISHFSHLKTINFIISFLSASPCTVTQCSRSHTIILIEDICLGKKHTNKIPSTSSRTNTAQLLFN